MKQLIDTAFVRLKHKQTEKLLLIFAAGIVWLPFLIWLFLIERYGVNIPLSDAWHVPGMQIAAYFQGKFQPSLLFEQHNESRKVIPTLIFMILPILTGEWNTRWEMFLGLAFAGIMSLLVLSLLQRTNRGHLFQNLMLVFFYNCLLLSPRAYFRWLNGITLHRLLPDACLIFNALIFTLQIPAALQVALLIVSGLIAQYSFSGGILIWFFSLPLVLELNFNTKQQKVKLFSLYCLSIFLSCTFYLGNYRQPEGHPSPIKILNFSLLDILQTWFAFLGNVLTTTFMPSFGFGLTVIFLLAIFCWQKSIFSYQVLPWIVLGSYSMGMAALATITRLPMEKLAGSERYLPHFVYLPLAIIVLLLIFSNQHQQVNLRRFALLLMGVILAIYYSSNFNGAIFDDFNHFHHRLRQEKACIQMTKFYQLENCSIQETVTETKQIYLLDQLGLLRPGIAKSLKFETQPGDWGYIELLRKTSAGILLKGWAWQEYRQPADAVAIMQKLPDGSPHIVAIWKTGQDRNGLNLSTGKWRGVLKIDLLLKEANLCSLDAYAVDTGNNRLLPLKRSEQMQAACK